MTPLSPRDCNARPWQRQGATCPSRWLASFLGLDEYADMFALTPEIWPPQILDCAGGPSSFTAEMCRAGRQVVSCDPVYGFAANEIARHIEETAPQILESAPPNIGAFVWTRFESPEQLVRRRRDIMGLFLRDFQAGLAESRYRVAELPALPFADCEFDLALCSHFLCTYSHVLSVEFHAFPSASCAAWPGRRGSSLCFRSLGPSARRGSRA
jgi:hypothetical protein